MAPVHVALMAVVIHPVYMQGIYDGTLDAHCYRGHAMRTYTAT